jgi:hypothetical protein
LAPEAEGVRFDGDLLYRREAAGASTKVWAGGFRELSIAGLVAVRSPTLIESLVLENDRCEVALARGQPGGLEVSLRKGVRLLIDGRPAPIDSWAIHSEVAK